MFLLFPKVPSLPQNCHGRCFKILQSPGRQVTGGALNDVLSALSTPDTVFDLMTHLFSVMRLLPTHIRVCMVKVTGS